MIFDRRRLLGLLVIGLAGASTVEVFAQETQDLPFRIDLPPGFVVKARPRGPDFNVYDVMKGDVGYVGVYFGGAAGFPMNPKAKVATGPTPNVQVADSAEGAPRREYLIKNKDGWGVLHVWTQGPPGDLAIAERIAASVRFK